MITLLYVLLGIIAIVFILGLAVPKSYDVYREVEVSRSKKDVFEYLRHMKNQEIWSPWAKKDPSMSRKYTGTDGQLGFVSYWNGNKSVGEGEQTIGNIIENERIEGELRFLKPFKSTSDYYFDVSEVEEGKTKIIWGFSGKNVFPINIFMLFVSMDKMVGKDFEEGLRDLKKTLEEE